MSTPTTTRPGGVTFVMVLIWIAAVFNAAVGIWLMLAPFGQNPTVSDHLGNAVELPGFWLFVNGALSLLLAFMYVWLARAAGRGLAGAQVIIQALAVINIIFAFFRLPYGWLALALNVAILVIVSGASAKAWFTKVE
jgi:hypothetical protein